ncbi:MAG TPA: aldehyde dehydrogenase family protein [Steroidobacteraceae bacterium]|nr:aldehyde dehydrogenase family protein [Steroidobacteraceae bacterium]
MNAQLQPGQATDFHLLIGGKLVPSAATFDVINPATEQVVAPCPRADLNQLNQAVAAAKAAFPAWAARPLPERRALLLKLADAIDARAPELAPLLTQEQGKPLGGAFFELMVASANIRGLAALELPDAVLSEDAQTKVIRQRRPLGVVAAITPWNFPVIMMVTKLTPALLAGNTVVVKPAPTTPLTTLKIGELCAEIFPAGVVNVIADANDLGNALTSHPDVAKIAFTGSTVTGRKVMASAAQTLKRLTLELGGNDAAIVLDDVDPKEIAPKLFFAAMINSGQVCLAAKRVYVPESIYDAVCAELGKLAAAAKVGNGLEEGVEFGPVQNRMQFEKVRAIIEDARRHGQVIAGGEPHQGPGFFIHPTVISGLPDSARLVCEEQFGPVMPVLKYKTLDEVIERANASEYGLGGTVWSKNTERALAVAQRLDTGTVWINKHLDLPPGVPYGGVKQSGFGVELGQQGLEEFTQLRILNVAK